MILIYRDVIISAKRTVDKGVIDVAETESWETLTVHGVQHMRNMGNGTEGRQKMPDEIQAEDKGVMVSVQVRWLASPHTIKEGRQIGEISASSMVFLIQECKVARGLVNEGINVVGVWN